MDEYIRDFNTRRIIGILDHKSNGDIYAIDFDTRMILGIYRASTNDTIEFNTRQVVAKGNVVVSFIYNKGKKCTCVIFEHSCFAAYNMCAAENGRLRASSQADAV